MSTANQYKIGIKDSSGVVISGIARLPTVEIDIRPFCSLKNA
jgi:hypothetical protein